MFRRFVTIVTILATSTFFLNGLSRAKAESEVLCPPKDRNRSCLSCVGAKGNSLVDTLDNLATLGRRTQVRPFAPIQRSVLDGAAVNLVSTATGHLAFSIIDLEIQGAMPIAFQRIYASDRTSDTGLGVGWSFALDDRITIVGDKATLSTGVGGVITFHREGHGQTFALSTSVPGGNDSFELTNENTIVESRSGLTRTYKRVGESYRLTRIADSNNQVITISINKQGNVTRIGRDGGGEITLQWSDAKNSRLLSVGDNSKRRIIFRHDGSRLRGVTDSAGAQWGYDYQAGRLSRATDPLNRVLLRARYDKTGRVVEAGDAAGQTRYDYDFGSGHVSRQTVITDPLGAKTTIAHAESGALTAISNDDGEELLRVEYDGLNRPANVANGSTGGTRFSYDEHNRVAKKSSTDGTFREYTYDERGLVSSVSTEAGRTDYSRDTTGNIVLATSNDPAQSYQATRNSRGQLTRIRSIAGSEFSFEHDSTGNTSAFTVAGSGRFEVDYDSAGNVTSRRLPSGAHYRYEYDARGVIAKQSDSKGQSVTFERDAGGAITGFITAAGDWVRATRDEAGRIRSLRTSAGKSRRFAYDTRGALIDYTDARGKHKRVGYDRRGRVQTIDDDYGNKTVIERDRRGRISSVNTIRGKNGWYLNGKYLAVKRDVRVGNFAPVISNVAHGRDASIAQVPDLSCLFDSWDDFMDPNSSLAFGDGCSDPFGGFAGDPHVPGGPGGYFGPFFGFGGIGSCTECATRQIDICVREARACNYGALQSGSHATATCIALLLVTAVGALACLGFSFGGTGMGGIACQAKYEACVLSAIDKCPQCQG